MNALLKQLHDIEGLDPISPWPLAMGWWILIGLSLFLFSIFIYFLMRWIAFKRSWKSDTLQKLKDLEANLSEATARESAILLSEYLRRIALKRFSRKQCAGLVGKSWLQWLTIHDLKSFDWEKRGTILIEVPYAPLTQNPSPSEIKDLIQAARHWVY